LVQVQKRTERQGCEHFFSHSVHMPAANTIFPLVHALHQNTLTV